MSNPSPSPSTRIKKGEVRNPRGGRAHDPVKVLTRSELERIASIIIKSSFDELLEIRMDPKSSVLEAMIASVAMKSIMSGSTEGLNMILDRLIGKVREKVELMGEGGGPLKHAVVVLPAKVPIEYATSDD